MSFLEDLEQYGDDLVRLVDAGVPTLTTWSFFVSRFDSEPVIAL